LGGEVKYLMATWTLVDSIGADSQIYSNATDGVDLYFVKHDSLGEIYKFDTALETQTRIDAGFSGHAIPTSSNVKGVQFLTWFNGKLYVATRKHPEINNVKVWRWTGSGTTWDEVFSVSHGSGFFATGLQSDGTHIVVVGADTSGGATNGTWYSTTGDSGDWTQGTVPITVELARYSNSNGTQRGIFKWMADQELIEGQTRKVFEFVDGDWVARRDESSDDWLYWTSDALLNWFQDSSTSEMGYSSTWTGITQSVADVDIRALSQINIPIPVGSKNTTGTLWIYFWDTDAGDWDVAGRESLPGSSGEEAHDIVRLDNNEVFVFSQNKSPANANQLWKRDEVLLDPVTPATHTFYFSQGLPLMGKSFHPFATVKPGNLDVGDDDDTVFLGTSTSTDTEKVARSDRKSSRDYADWSGVTDEFTDDDVDGLEVF
jgi:hypothetical protein